jgi:hypothetical protein
LNRTSGTAAAVLATVVFAGAVGCSSGSPSPAATLTVTATPVAPSAPATPAAQVRPALTASQIATGMDIGSFTAYTAETDPNHLLGRQREYTSKINWSAGSIEVFSDAADAKARQAYVRAFTCPLGDGYDYLDGTVLLRLDCSMTPAEAKASEALFGKVVTGA